MVSVDAKRHVYLLNFKSCSHAARTKSGFRSMPGACEDGGELQLFPWRARFGTLISIPLGFTAQLASGLGT